MKLVKKEDTAKNVVKLTIEIDKETFAEGINQAYRKNVKKINIPGFRKGKAPRGIIEQFYGEGVFYEDAVNFVCPDAYEAAVKEAGIEPVDRPEIDIESIGHGEPLVITALVTVKPEVELGEYKGVSAEKVEYKTTDEDVQKEIDAACNVCTLYKFYRVVQKPDSKVFGILAMLHAVGGIEFQNRIDIITDHFPKRSHVLPPELLFFINIKLIFRRLCIGYWKIPLFTPLLFRCF